MKGVVRSPGGFSWSILILAMLQCAVVSQSGLTTSAATSEFQHHEQLELQGSIARYRHLLKHDSSRDVLQDTDLKQVNENHHQRPEHQSKKKIKAHGKQKNEDHSNNDHSSNVQQQSEEKFSPEQKNEGLSNEHEPEETKLEAQEKIDHQQSEEKKVEEEKTEEPFVFPKPYLLGLPIKDWDQQRARWLEANSHLKPTSEDKPRVLIVSGSQPWPCRTAVGDNFHLKSLKSKIDYARLHNYEIYYNFVWLDPLFGAYWVKLPLLRTLMLTHPEIEWFLWVDADAVFTDMLFEAPFQSYEGKNMVMWGYDYGFFTERSWIGINAGVFLIRNCQWSLDLFDKWSPMGPEGQVRDEYGKILTNFLSGRHKEYPADDQSALAYVMLTDEEVLSKIQIVENEYKMSAYWPNIVDKYETYMEKYHPGLGDDRWPWITHFTGCSPCGGGNNPDHSYESCMDSFGRAFNFADNQVLAYLGLQHESLQSPELIRTRNETDRPLDLVGVNPWAARISQLAADTPP